MIRIQDSGEGFLAPRSQLLIYSREPCLVSLPIKHVQIDWGRKRGMMLDTVEGMWAYLLKLELLGVLDAEKHPISRLIFDMMWTKGARISEVIALTSRHFIDNVYDGMVLLRSLKQRPGRQTTSQLVRDPKRATPMVDPLLIDRIQSYIYSGHSRMGERMFTMTCQIVVRHMHDLAGRGGGASSVTPCAQRCALSAPPVD